MIQKYKWNDVSFISQSTAASSACFSLTVMANFVKGKIMVILLKGEK